MRKQKPVAQGYIWRRPKWPALSFNLDTHATAAIEGEQLDLNAVRSSVHRTLGLGLHNIKVGQYRDHADDMQIVSGSMVTGFTGREVVHHVAPPSIRVAKEMNQFLTWFEKTKPAPGGAPSLNGLIRAAVTHLWFESIHPFEDGNDKKHYYDHLNAAQKGDTDITAWVQNDRCIKSNRDPRPSASSRCAVTSRAGCWARYALGGGGRRVECYGNLTLSLGANNSSRTQFYVSATRW
jgi:hypothetical protein